MGRRWITAFLALVLLPLVVVSSASGAGAQSPPPPLPPMAASARGSIEQVSAVGLSPGASVTLLDPSGNATATGTTDEYGAYLFHEVDPAAGYVVTSDGFTSGPLTVTGPTGHPGEDWYVQQATDSPLGEGYGYLTTRDGTTLSVNVTFPKDGSTGPWPVLLDYSGYDPSEPGTTPQEAAVYSYQGYVVVGVNMRGTGCSGGAFSFMETPQSTDGYDIVELLAQQPWGNGDVGMVGISYSGYSQLYVAATQPPHLDAIAPLSPYSDTYSAILYPGGILNNGFAVDWATERENNGKPSARPWVRRRIANGDTVCAENQALRLQGQRLLSLIQGTPFADHRYDYLNTETFVRRIKVPTYLAAQWQDEQTGGSAANLVAHFDPTTKLYASFTNGTHIEPMAPAALHEVMTFVDLYVGHRKPATSALLYLGAGKELAKAFGSEDEAMFMLPYNPGPSEPNYETALAKFEATPRIRIAWETGAVQGREGGPFPAAVTRTAGWPPPGLSAEAIYLQPDGALATSPASVPDGVARASSSYVYDPASKRRSTFAGTTEQAWRFHPDYKWDVLAEGKSLNFLSEPYTTRTAYAGGGSVDLWVRSSAADTDVEVTLTEVRPDGQEVYIQSGWLRASHRKLDPARSTELVPYQDHQAVDAAPLPAGQFSPVRIELFPFAHVIRPGSRLRVNVEAPGGNQPFWEFESLSGTSVNEVGHSAAMPSRVVLPKLAAADVPNVAAELPACQLPGVDTQAVSLRNQPCRAYQPARIATAVTAVPGPAGSATVSWTPPPGTSADEWVITPVLDGPAPPGTVPPAPQTVPGATSSAVFTGLPAGVPVSFTVRAVVGGVQLPASNASLPVLFGTAPSTTAPTTTANTITVGDPVNPPSNPGPTTPPSSGLGWLPELHGSWEAFVRDTLTRLAGRAPSGWVRHDVARLEAGLDPGAYVAGVRRGSDARAVTDPLLRLYRAALGRSPRPAELRVWEAIRRRGVSMSSIAQIFVNSPEFGRRHGKLSNEQFGRLAAKLLDPAAPSTQVAAAWTAILDDRVRTRGQALASIIDEARYRTLSQSWVDVVATWIGLLDREPSAKEITTATARLEGGTPLSTLASELLASDEYYRRVRRLSVRVGP